MLFCDFENMGRIPMDYHHFLTKKQHFFGTPMYRRTRVIGMASALRTLKSHWIRPGLNNLNMSMGDFQDNMFH